MASEFSKALGRRLAELRADLGVTADEVAASARLLGLTWQRSTVARIETGQRDVSTEEFLLLPTVLQWTTAGGVPWDETAERRARDIDHSALLPSGQVEVTPGATTTRHGLKSLLITGAAAGIDGWAFPLADDEHARFVEEQEARAAATYGEAEQKAARRLGRPVSELAEAAFALWGRTLSDERERRLSDDGEAATQGRRGHVTRKLLAEIESYLKGA